MKDLAASSDGPAVTTGEESWNRFIEVVQLGTSMSTLELKHDLGSAVR
jgi:hypothetical protein